MKTLKMKEMENNKKIEPSPGDYKKSLKEEEKEKRHEIVENLQKIKKDFGTVALILGAAFVTFSISRRIGRKKSNKKSNQKFINEAYSQLPPPIIYQGNGPGNPTRSTIVSTVIRKLTEITLDIVEDRLKAQISNLGKEKKNEEDSE